MMSRVDSDTKMTCLVCAIWLLLFVNGLRSDEDEGYLVLKKADRNETLFLHTLCALLKNDSTITNKQTSSKEGRFPTNNNNNTQKHKIPNDADICFLMQKISTAHDSESKQNVENRPLIPSLHQLIVQEIHAEAELQAALSAHNKYRRMNDVSEMKLNYKMSDEARDFAKAFAESGNLKYKKKTVDGENLAYGCSSNGHFTLQDATNLWYKESCSRGAQVEKMHPSPKAAHFMQLIFDGSKELGMGSYEVDRGDKKCTYIVARYRPGLNRTKHVDEGVKRTKLAHACENLKKRKDIKIHRIGGLMQTAGSPLQNETFINDTIDRATDKYIKSVLHSLNYCGPDSENCEQNIDDTKVKKIKTLFYRELGSAVKAKIASVSEKKVGNASLLKGNKYLPTEAHALKDSQDNLAVNHKNETLNATSSKNITGSEIYMNVQDGGYTGITSSKNVKDDQENAEIMGHAIKESNSNQIRTSMLEAVHAAATRHGDHGYKSKISKYFVSANSTNRSAMNGTALIKKGNNTSDIKNNTLVKSAHKNVSNSDMNGTSHDKATAFNASSPQKGNATSLNDSTVDASLFTNDNNTTENHSVKTNEMENSATEKENGSNDNNALDNNSTEKTNEKESGADLTNVTSGSDIPATNGDDLTLYNQCGTVRFCNENTSTLLKEICCGAERRHEKVDGDVELTNLAEDTANSTRAEADKLSTFMSPFEKAISDATGNVARIASLAYIAGAKAGMREGIRLAGKEPLIDNTCIELQKAAIGAHNELRRSHNVAPLKLDREMSDNAQEYAEHLAKHGEARHAGNLFNTGENIAFACYNEPSKELPVSDAIKNWYNEGCEPEYDFGNEKGGRRTNRFTQLIWANSSKLGIGRAVGKRGDQYCTYIVARYYPTGNSIGKYKENVFRGSGSNQLKRCLRLNERLLGYSACPYRARIYDSKTFFQTPFQRSLLSNKTQNSTSDSELNMISESASSSEPIILPNVEAYISTCELPLCNSRPPASPGFSVTSKSIQSFSPQKDFKPRASIMTSISQRLCAPNIFGKAFITCARKRQNIAGGTKKNIVLHHKRRRRRHRRRLRYSQPISS